MGFLRHSKRALGLVSIHERRELVIDKVSGGIYAPFIGSNRDIVGKHIVTGVVKINEAAECIAIKQYVVTEQIAMNDAMWQT